MKKHISKVMLIFSIAFFAIALITVVATVGRGYSFDDNQKVQLILQFLSSGIFIGLYRIIDLLEKNQNDGGK
jgi:hypothetical protein